MRYLALDIGSKRTGVAYGDSSDDILFSLASLQHASVAELLESIAALVTHYRIDEVVLGLPLLPGGTEGKQATSVRNLAKALHEANIHHSFLDERYTSKADKSLDLDASAACQLLMVKLKMKRDVSH